MSCCAEESNPIYFFMRSDFIHHRVDPLSVIFQHLKVCRMQDNFTDSFNIILGILQKNFFKCTDIERGKKGDCDEQHNTSSECEFADQTLIKRSEYRHKNRPRQQQEKTGCMGRNPALSNSPWQPGCLSHKTRGFPVPFSRKYLPFRGLT